MDVDAAVLVARCERGLEQVAEVGDLLVAADEETRPVPFLLVELDPRVLDREDRACERELVAARQLPQDALVGDDLLGREILDLAAELRP